METPQTTTDKESLFFNRIVESAVRAGVLLAIAVWCFRIVQPFLVPILWGAVIAVAMYPAYHWLEARLNGRAALAAVLLGLLMMLVLIGPTLLFADSLASGVERAAAAYHEGTLAVPPPPESVREWPLIGTPTFDFWKLASENTQQALLQLKPVLPGAGKWLLGVLTSTAVAVLQFMLAIVIASVMLAHAPAAARAARGFALRLAPLHGAGYAEIAERTIRSVAAGVVGVATLQGILAGIGFLVAGVPAAGLLTLVCIVLGVVQVGPILVLLGATIHLYSIGENTTATVFLVWSIFVATMDNVLRPLLLGRGVKVPMLVVFIGAIGGLISIGLIGLFLGGVVFTIGYEIFRAWLNPPDAADSATTDTAAADTSTAAGDA